MRSVEAMGTTTSSSLFNVKLCLLYVVYMQLVSALPLALPFTFYMLTQTQLLSLYGEKMQNC